MPKAFDTEASARAREVAEQQKTKYREIYHDDEYWSEIARGLGTRIPRYFARPSDQEIKHWLKLARVPYHQFVEAYGWKDAAEFEAMNPTHGMKVLAGLILELGEENKRLKKLARERCDDILVNTGLTSPPPIKLYKGQSKMARRLVEAMGS